MKLRKQPKFTILHMLTFATFGALIGIITKDIVHSCPEYKREPTSQPVIIYEPVLVKPWPETQAIALVPSPEANAVLADTLSNNPNAWINDLWAAMCYVESRHDPRAVNAAEGAVGIVQITPICVQDVNQILELQGSQKCYTLEDRFSPARSREMWEIYLRHWASKVGSEQWEAETWARIWSGGPDGWEEDSTFQYWRRVKRAMQ